VVLFFIRDPDTMARIAVIKGWAYVALTALLLYTLVRRAFHRQKKVEQALREREATLRSIFDSSPVGIAMTVDRVLQKVNCRFCELTGYGAEELVQKDIRLFYADAAEYERIGVYIGETLRDATPHTVETKWRRKDGAIIDVLLCADIILVEEGVTGLTITTLDITERIRQEQEREQLEGQLRQAQKMEAVGQLAGGVAHDFNNLLQAIRGYTELALDDVPLGSPARDCLEEIDKAGEQASALVRQLLTFSRRSAFQRKPLDLNTATAFSRRVTARRRSMCSSSTRTPSISLYSTLLCRA
jgi:PAS domain S-box-containing protein